MRRLSLIAVLALFLALAAARTGPAETRFPLRTDWVGSEVARAQDAGGPDKVPQQLLGLWKVSLCVKPGLHRGHAWIRYENVETGEVHTVGRFQKNVRPTRDRQTREVLYPRTRESGLHWDYDWRFEHEVRAGKYVIGTVVVRDPQIFGHDHLYGHGTIRDNCITYARDAWEFYSGQRFDLAIIHTPEGFLREIASEGVNAPPSATGWTSSPELRRLPPVE